MISEDELDAKLTEAFQDPLEPRHEFVDQLLQQLLSNDKPLKTDDADRMITDLRPRRSRRMLAGLSIAAGLVAALVSGTLLLQESRETNQDLAIPATTSTSSVEVIDPATGDRTF